MEFVSSYVHLGHLISDKLDDSCDISQRRCVFIGQVNNVLWYFQTSVLLLSISCFSLTALVSMGVSFGIWGAIRLLIFVLLGGKVLGEFGIYHHMHTVIFYRYSASVFLRMMRSVGVQ